MSAGLPQDPAPAHVRRIPGEIPVLVLNWNGFEDTVQCIDALLKNAEVEFRVILVDNGSSGDDLERLTARYGRDSRIEVRGNASNLGFAKGMNKLLLELLRMGDERPEYVALLNNDATPTPEWLAALARAAAETGAGALASRMLRHDDDSRLDNAGHMFMNTGEVLPRGAGRPPAEFDAPAEVAGACGGACLLSLDMLDDIGIFDEFFDTGYEDAELGIRAMIAGYRQIYVPGAIVRHRIGASIDKIRDRQYAIRLQININYAYLKLMPVAVMVWNAPWILARTLALLIVPLLTFRWRLFSVQLAALAQSGRVARHAYLGRKTVGRRRISAVQIILRQKFFAGVYWGYFKRFVWQGERTIFER